MRVLIADDNLDLADALASVLRSRGADPVVTGDGAAALQVAADNGPFDAAVVDLLLPGAGGVDVLAQLSERGGPGVLLAMTGYERAHDRERLRDLGIGAPLRKPFAVPELLQRLGLGDTPGATVPLRARVALLIRKAAADPAGLVCGLDRFTDPDVLREAVAEHPYDAALVLSEPSPDRAELVEDLKALDRDLGVLTTPEPSLVAGAIERTRERREASREAALLGAMFEACADPLLVVAGDPPTIERVNRELVALVGLRPDELRGQPLALLDDPATDDQGLVAAWREVQAGSGELAAETRLRIHGGALRPVRARFVRLLEQGSAVAVTLEGAEDRRGHEEALRVLGATAAGVAHEMRNALAGIGSSLEILGSRFDDDSQEADLLHRVSQRVDRAAEVMSDLLAYARPTVPRLKVVPLRMVLGAAADQVRSAAPEGVEVDVELDDPTLKVWLDPVGIQGALVNLGNNAVQAVGERGSVRFCGRLDGESVELRVIDDGPGIPPEMASKVFEPFFTTRARGSGLGLANVRKVVEAHGGRVEVLDRRPGAHFALTLPARPQEIEEERTA